MEKLFVRNSRVVFFSYVINSAFQRVVITLSYVPVDNSPDYDAFFVIYFPGIHLPYSSTHIVSVHVDNCHIGFSSGAFGRGCFFYIDQVVCGGYILSENKRTFGNLFAIF